MYKFILYLIILGILVAFPAQGQLLLYEDHTVPQADQAICMHFSSDNRFLACGTKKGEILIWDLTAKKPLHNLQHGSQVNSLLFDSESKILLSAGTNKKLKTWDLYSGQEIREIEEYKGKINHISFSPDEKIISVSGSRNEIYLIEYSTGKIAGMLRNGHTDAVLYSTFHAGNEQLISLGKDNQLIYWDINTKQVLRKSEISPRTINESGIEIQSAQSTPDNKKLLVSFLESRLAKGGGSMIFKYNIAVYDRYTGMLDKVIEGNVKNIETFCITPDNKYYITDNSTLRLKKVNFWDIQSGEIVKNHNINNEISALAVSDNGTYIAIAEESKGPSKQSDIIVYKLSGLDMLYTAQTESSIESNKVESPIYDKPSENLNVALGITGKYYALIIGINDYEDPQITDLDAPMQDATNLYSIIESAYNFAKEDILFLKNPTRKEIIDALDYLERTVTPDDNLLIFYAGHGHWDDNSHKGYWLPSDANALSTSNWLRNTSLTGYISSIKSKHTLLIADACFAGSIFKTRTAFPRSVQAVQRLYSLPSRKAMTSGNLKEVPDQSIFLKYLIKRLEENNEKYLPSEQLFYSLKPAVLNNSNNIPLFGEVQQAGDEGGDFIFIRIKPDFK